MPLESDHAREDNSSKQKVTRAGVDDEISWQRSGGDQHTTTAFSWLAVVVGRRVRLLTWASVWFLAQNES
jgi:hypothetical protein